MHTQTQTINFEVPAGWSELTHKQLQYVYRLIAEDIPTDVVKLLCLLKWSKTKVIGKQSDGKYLLKQGDTLFEVTLMQVAEVLTALDWLAELPTTPVRLLHIRRNGRRYKALPADFEGVPFETYIIVDNLFQGYLKTQSDALLDELATVIYPGVSTLRTPLSAENRIAIFYWVASLKDFFAKRYPDFLQPAEAAADGNLLGPGVRADNIEASMNAQIRALTKGDITKEQEVLALDTHRALTELNAQAREYKELNAQIKSK